METIKARLMNKVEMIPLSGCWIWMGATDKHGYGRVFAGGKNAAAHRVSFEAHKGPAAADVCHTCDVPCCINPDHLFDGSHSDNMIDREKKGRANKACGERNSMHRFSFEQICRMRTMKAAGHSLGKIAQEFGISGTGYVSQVVNGKIRKLG